MEKKVVCIIDSPYSLLQVLWYHAVYPNYSYYAYVKSGGYGETLRNEMLLVCKKSNIFKSINSTNMIDLNSSKLRVFQFVTKLGVGFIFGSKKKITKGIITEQIGNFDFDIAIADRDNSIIGGAFIDWASERDIIIVEDGLRDFSLKKSKPDLSLREFLEFIVVKMGYFNPNGKFILANLKECSKFCSCENLMEYKDYKKIISLFVLNYEQKIKYEQTVINAFSLRELKLDKYDFILFTSTLHAFTDNKEKEEQFHNSIYMWLLNNAKGKKILIKKHPRDTYEYQWNNLNIDFLDQIIPTESIVMLMNPKQSILLEFISTIVLTLLSNKLPFQIFRTQNFNKRYENSMDYWEEKLMLKNNIITLE